MSLELLPDCRAKTPRFTFVHGRPWVPVFCANCGKEGGLCPEENMTFLFYICPKCFETHGHLTNTMVMPDEVFFAKVRDAQLEEHGRYLTHTELLSVVAEDASPLATLLKEAS